MTETSRTRLGPVEAFRDFPTRITIGSRTLFLVRQDRGFCLLSNVCPHQGGAVDDRSAWFECPQHGWRFDRSTGRCLNAPSRALTAFAVTVEDGVLYAELPDDAPVTRRQYRGVVPKQGLTIQLHAHACLEISYEGFTLLTDPWLDGPAFLGAWAPYPPHQASGADLRPDAILITHEHSDHFHEPTLRHFGRRTPIYVPDFPNQRMPRRLAALGFTDVRLLQFGAVATVAGGWRITAFDPDSYWNDALLLVDIDGFRILNVNDAGINGRIASAVAPVDLLTVQFSAGASGYPWTWAHLTDQQKIAISAEACAGKLRMIREATSVYRSASVLPFASHFALWHPAHRDYARMMKRNTLADVKAILDESDVNTIDLLPGDKWDVGTGLIERASEDAGSGGDPDHVTDSLASAVSETAFAAAHPSDEGLSRSELVDYLLRLNDVPDIVHCEDVTVRLSGTPSSPARETIDVSFAIAAGCLTILSTPVDRPNLVMTMPLAILTAVIREGLSWDEPFIGYWCQFDRHPDVYHAGFWRLFQAPYLKRPVDLRPAEGARIGSAATVAEVLEAHGAQADRILRRYGLYCNGCHHSTAESIGMAARQHGIDPQRVEHLITELNRAFG